MSGFFRTLGLITVFALGGAGGVAVETAVRDGVASFKPATLDIFQPAPAVGGAEKEELSASRTVAPSSIRDVGRAYVKDSLAGPDGEVMRAWAMSPAYNSVVNKQRGNLDLYIVNPHRTEAALVSMNCHDRDGTAGVVQINFDPVPAQGWRLFDPVPTSGLKEDNLQSYWCIFSSNVGVIPTMTFEKNLYLAETGTYDRELFVLPFAKFE